LRLLLSTGLGICCSVESIKAKKPGKYFSTSSGVFSLCNVVFQSILNIYNILYPNLL
jgi:hypothetical protein